MSTDEPFRTDYELLKGVDYIFVSLDRNLSGEECHELAEKYFETHKGMTLPGQALRVDLRPAFRKPLADVTAQIPRCFYRLYFHATAMSIGTYGEPNAISNAIGYAKFFSRSHDAVIRVSDEGGNVIETHEHAGDSRES